MAVHGTVAPGFEPVAAQLARLIASGEERGCAATAYVDGKPVVDIWAGLADAGPWQEDTLAVTYSVTKGPAAMCIQVLSDRGVLDVDAPVSRYWPEYGARGKEATLIRHLLNHTAAQFTYPDYWRDIGPDGRALANHEMVAGRLAASPPAWAPGERPMYHAITYGYLLGELVRRVDGRTLGQFFRDEIAAPLGLEYWIGLPDEQVARVAAPRADGLPRGRRLRYRRRIIEAGREKVRGDDVFHAMAWPYALVLAHPDIKDPLELSRLGSEPWIWRAELPASNGIGTARALARMYAMLAEGGELDGRRIVSRESIRRFSDRAQGKGGGFALGYGAIPPFLQSLGVGAHAFGSAGAGGSLALADPTNRVSFALTKNQMRDAGTAGFQLLFTLYRCLGRGNRLTRFRRAAASGFLNQRSLAAALSNGAQWLGTFRSIERGFSMGAD